MSDQNESMKLWDAVYLTGLLGLAALALVATVACHCAAEIVSGTCEKCTKKEGS